MNEFHHEFKIGDRVMVLTPEGGRKQGTVKGYYNSPEMYEVITDDEKNYYIVGNGRLRKTEESE